MATNVVYCITTPARDLSYVGVTKTLGKRVRQHRTEIVGGARATKKQGALDWRLACHVSGFKDRTHALQFEWRWQHALKRKRRHPATNVPLKKRLHHLAQTLSLERVTKTAPLATDHWLTLHWNTVIHTPTMGEQLDIGGKRPVYMKLEK